MCIYYCSLIFIKTDSLVECFVSDQQRRCYKRQIVYQINRYLSYSYRNCEYFRNKNLKNTKKTTLTINVWNVINNMMFVHTRKAVKVTGCHQWKKKEAHLHRRHRRFLCRVLSFASSFTILCKRIDYSYILKWVSEPVLKLENIFW